VPQSSSKKPNHAENPLLQEWTTPFQAPPFADIRPEHFLPAFEVALAAHRAEIEVIKTRRADPTFENTIEALELSGHGLRQVSAVFFNLCGAHTNDELQKIEREMAPKLARHRNAIYLDETLYKRIEHIYSRRQGLNFTPEQRQVLERYRTAFVRSGAALDVKSKKRMAEIGERMATLGTSFGQNVLADEKAWTLPLESSDDRSGLPDFLVKAAEEAAEERGLKDKHVITLGRSMVEPFLQFSPRRDLRETAWRAWIARGENGGSTDNRAVVTEMVALRNERAKLMDFPSFAHFKLDDSMAKTPEAARELLQSVWTPAVAQAKREQEALQEMVREEGGNFEIAPWDWRYYSEKRRKQEFDLDEGELKPYLQLDKMIEAAFDTAAQLFGLRFQERKDVPVYHPDVRAWEVTNEHGELVGLFYGDYFARPSKRSGAWMSGFRPQEKLAGNIRPIIVNVMNFAKAADGEPSLLSFDDAKTLFHEFGHGLHGLLSNVTYPMISGTSVLRDFVEFPSQIYENWLEQPEILGQYAVHYKTNEPMPKPLLERLLAARNFNQGFANVEYVSSALVDLDLHEVEDPSSLDVTAFEKESLEKIGMPDAIVMRHRLPHFGHLFSGDGYAAGYYSYLWSDVLAADGFAAFEEAGNIFDPNTARKLQDHVYASGFSLDPADAYREFRGRRPSEQAVLRRRGLAA
jgi:peptidyl-dipeptidase Dcp